MTSGDGGGEDVESDGDDAMLCVQGCITDGRCDSSVWGGKG